MTFEDLKRALELAVFVIMIICLAAVAMIMLLLAIDAPTQKYIGTEQVKCIDDVGAEFIDEWCDKKIYCSWLGITSSGKCKDVDGGYN